jgi:hypothetical protein
MFLRVRNLVAGVYLTHAWNPIGCARSVVDKRDTKIA